MIPSVLHVRTRVGLGKVTECRVRCTATLREILTLGKEGFNTEHSEVVTLSPMLVLKPIVVVPAPPQFYPRFGVPANRKKPQ